VVDIVVGDMHINHVEERTLQPRKEAIEGIYFCFMDLFHILKMKSGQVEENK